MTQQRITDQITRLMLHSDNQHYSVQVDKDTYLPADHTLTSTTLTDHIEGSTTIGLKLLQPGTNAAKVGCVDIDTPRDAETLEEAYKIATRIQTAAAAEDIPAYIEFSGRRGWHVWIFSEQPVPGRTMRAALKRICDEAVFMPEEIFPASETISADGRTGEGKSIKLPCGIHKGTGKRTGFVDEAIVWEAGYPVLPEDQAGLLETFKQASAKTLAKLSAREDQPVQATNEALVDFSNLKDGEHPPFIEYMLEHGAPADVDYNRTNLTLIRYALARGFDKNKALALAREVAKRTPDSHPTEKKTVKDKVRNFKSAWESASRNPAQYPFSYSYVLESVELREAGVIPSNALGIAAAGIPERKGTPADTLVERDILSYVLRSPEEAYQEIIKAIPPDTGFLGLLYGDEKTRPLPVNRALWKALKVLLQEGKEIRDSTVLAQFEKELRQPVASSVLEWFTDLKAQVPPAHNTFKNHLKRVKETGQRVEAEQWINTTMELLSAPEPEPLTNTLSALIARSQDLQRRQSEDILPMQDHTSELVHGLFEKSNVTIPTPSKWLNSTLNGGFLPGSLYVMAAPPAAGKTTFTACLGDYAAANQIPVLYVSYEMSMQQLWCYSLARLGRINSAFIEGRHWERTGFKNDDKRVGKLTNAIEAYNETVAPYLTILEAGVEHTPAYLNGAIAQVRHNLGLPDDAPVLIIVDYLQCMNSGEDGLDSGANETAKVSRIATDLKRLARSTGTAVIAISDITKQAYTKAMETGKLNMGALRDSFKISHAADTIMLLTSEPITISPKKGEQYKKDVLELAREGLDLGSRKYEGMLSIEAKYPLSEKTKDTYAQLQIVKNRGGMLSDPLFKYEKALHNFVSIDLDLSQEEQEMSEDAFT